MDCISTRLPYRHTGAFAKIVLDYIDQSPALKPFYANPPGLNGIQKTIDSRRKFPTDRKTLVAELKKQYSAIGLTPEVQKNIESLLSPETFTVTTAHQNNLFTGPLYFIYKIVHAIRLAEHLNTSFKSNYFVPVFYMGSEDADLAELNHINLDGQKWEWKTKQTGAVGRMKVDKELINLIDSISGRVKVLPFGEEIINNVKGAYREGTLIQEATFKLIHSLFAEYGLIVLIADTPALKKQMKEIFLDDLFNQSASAIVEKSVGKLQDAGYKVQANPREINLFYLDEGLRERIQVRNGKYEILNSKISFSKEELLKEVENHPEKFSPNVILRGLYQEAILPNVVFIGGGGELAYWLELKELFDKYKTPFPVLVLRNSFLIIEQRWQQLMSKAGLGTDDIFLDERELLNRHVSKNSSNKLQLNGSITETEQLYNDLRKQAGSVDVTLEQHVDALKLKTLQRLHELEKKMLRAEKRKFGDQQRQIHTIKSHLFPANGLQERYDNLLYYYSKWGRDFIHKLQEHSLALEQEFVIMSEK
jgi:bacillithiol synthase